jgi:hypothetical protein
MPLLLMTAASILCPPHMRQLHYGGQSDLELFQSLRPSHRDVRSKFAIADPSGAARISEQFADPVPDQIGLIQGICDETAGPGVAAVVSALTIAAPNARRICIVSDRKYDDYLNLSEPWQGYLVYQGILQYWPGRTSHVILRSYIEPVE